jgi:hypothetical protein
VLRKEVGILGNPLATHGHETPGVEVGVVPLSDCHPKVGGLAIDELRAGPPFSLLVALDVLNSVFVFCLEEISLAAREDEDSGCSEILARKAISKNVSHQQCLMLLKIVYCQSLVLKRKVELWILDCGQNHNRIVLLSIQFRF